VFTVDTRTRRRLTTTTVFREFATACRSALARVEAEQVVL
jgi:hypothetical protein